VFAAAVIALKAVAEVFEPVRVQFVLTPGVSVQPRVMFVPGMMFRIGS
jgi:hypothetical protein